MKTTYATKMEAIEASHRGWNVQMPKPVGMVIYNFLKNIGLKEPATWYVEFYTVIMQNELFPRLLPTHIVLFYYIKALKAGVVRLEGHTPGAHEVALTEFFNAKKKTKVGTYTYRELLYMKLRDNEDYLDMDLSDPIDFTYLTKKKKPAKSRPIQINQQTQLHL